MPDYSLSKIYKIVNSKNDKVYIGSTTRKLLCMRMGGHRKDALTRPSLLYVAMRTIGIDKFKIELIKEYPCFTKAELEKEEFRIISKVIKRRVSLYNTVTESGITPTSMRVLRSKAHFNRGCLRFSLKDSSWVFLWCPVMGKGQKSKSFSVNKYGEVEAKEMAIAYQDMIYPKNV